MNEIILKQDDILYIQKGGWRNLYTLQELHLLIYYNDGWKTTIVKSDPEIKIRTQTLVDYMIKDIKKDRKHGSEYDVEIYQEVKLKDIELDEIEVTQPIKDTLLSIINTLSLKQYSNIIFK